MSGQSFKQDCMRLRTLFLKSFNFNVGKHKPSFWQVDRQVPTAALILFLQAERTIPWLLYHQHCYWRGSRYISLFYWRSNHCHWSVITTGIINCIIFISTSFCWLDLWLNCYCCLFLGHCFPFWFPLILNINIVNLKD